MKKVIGAALAAAVLAPATALATLGYFSDGYGLKAEGMGGVAIALPQDAMSGITNPANLGFVGNRLDVQLEWFRPVRNADVNGANAFTGTWDANGRKDFLIPGAAFNRMIRPDLAVGLLLYGNGGMNTTFSSNPFRLGGAGSNPGGVDYMQLFVAPTVAWKPNDRNSIGLSINFAYHQFSAQGLEAFGAFGFSSNPANLTNRGRDHSTGLGFRVGWTGKVSDRVTLGAMYQPKTNMGKLGDYSGLFRNQGDLDIPATYGVGIAVAATPKLTIAADVQRIDYAKVASIGTSSACLFAGTCQLGAANGPGFGWNNMTAYKIGASYAYSRTLTLRAGFATGKQPIPASETLLNIIFPAVVQNHITLGATWALDSMEITAGYMHAFKQTVNGSGSIPALLFGPGEANLRMYQDSLGVAFGWKM